MSVLEDYYWKESSSFPYPWQKRFFELFEEDTGNYVLYRVKQNDGKPKGRIPVRNIQSVIPYTQKPKELRFKIIIPGRTYFMKAKSVDMREKWTKALLDSVKKMESLSSKRLEEAQHVKTVENTDAIVAMSEYIHNINAGFRFLNSILSTDECFNLFATSMNLTSYFDLAVYAPLFEKLYRELYRVNVRVEVKLEKTSSVDLAKEKFEKFLMIAEGQTLDSSLRGAEVEQKISRLAQEVLKTVEKYRKGAEKVNQKYKAKIIDMVDVMEEFFKMLAEV